jgi:hypothetical protein
MNCPILKGWRTVFVNAFLAIAATLLLLTDQLMGFNWIPFVGAKWTPVAVIAVNMINIYMRYITTTAVGEKSDK